MSDMKYSQLIDYKEHPVEEMKQRATDFYRDMKLRRSIRDFSDRPVPREIIEDCLRAAGTSPSGANMQPWFFSVVSDPEVKRRIRKASEEKEGEFYKKRAPKKWLDALKPLGTDAHKPFLETAPYLITIFSQRYGVLPDGNTKKHYYVTESVGIATGVLITAIHNAGLVSLTYTPSPMNFLNKILGRPVNERPFLILVVGYPAEHAAVPEIGRKSLTEISEFI